MKKNCQICNEEFTTTRSNTKNCKIHRKLNPSSYCILNNILHRKCCFCMEYKILDDFYPKKNSRGMSWCKSCFNKNNTIIYQKNRGLSRKIDFIKKLGGKCSSCGYNRNIAAMCFHHINPGNKSFQLDMRTLSNNSLEVLYKELEKCIVLCHICHMEQHYPELSGLL